jgi:hypothetical protein
MGKQYLNPTAKAVLGEVGQRKLDISSPLVITTCDESGQEPMTKNSHHSQQGAGGVGSYFAS